jgi:glycosyltransferase involved in cell wall biosynthesis
MNVFFVSQYFHPEKFSHNRIVDHLCEGDNAVDVLCAVPNYPSGKFFEGFSNGSRRYEESGRISVRRVWTVARGRSSFRLFLNYVTFPLMAGIDVAFRKRRPDVTFVSQLSPILMLIPGILQRRKTGCGLVFWVQDMWPDSATVTLDIRSKWVLRLARAICGYLYRQADIVLVQGAAFVDIMADFGVPRDRIRVLPNTAPPMYLPMRAEDAPHFAAIVPQEGFRLMFAGNIGESQDFDTLIAAAERLRDRKELSWVILGSGRDEQRVRRLVKEKGLDGRVRFLGRRPEEDMPALFAHADALIISLRDEPIFAQTVPYKTQCYLACGKPIVASLNGEGARIIMEAGAGVAVPASRPELLARAISDFMDLEPQRQAEYGANGRRYFEANYAPAVVYGKLEAALKEAVELSARRRSAH